MRKRVTAAWVPARRPIGPFTSSLDVPTQSASALNANRKPLLPPAPISSPRVPAAAIAIDRPLLRARSIVVGADPIVGARLSEPSP